MCRRLTLLTSLFISALLTDACSKKDEAKTSPEKTVRHAPKIADLLVRHAQVPHHEDSGPLSWPVVLLLDKNHRAIPPKTSMKDMEGRKRRTAMAPADHDSQPPASGFQSRLLLVAAKPGDVAPNGGIWKSVNADPAGGGGGNHSSVSRDGSSSEYDADDHDTTFHNKDGSTDVVGDDGSWTHTDPPGGGENGQTGWVKAPNGDQDFYYDDGSKVHAGHDGSDYTDNSDGSRTRYNDDGSTTTVTQDGTIINTPPPGPGDDLGNPPSNRGPGWKNDKPGGGTGEPHYITRDGANITTQAAGEFVLVSGVPGHEVQARQQPCGVPPNVSQNVSAITALAFRVNEAKVEARQDGTVMINGEPAIEGDFVQGDIPGGGAVGVWRRDGKLLNVAVVWPDLSVVWITRAWSYLSFVVQWREMAPAHHGILGSNDDDPANDLTDRSGKLQANDPGGIASFVESWRITDAESLFTYAPGQSTATFTDKDFPHPVPVPDLKAAPADLSSLPAGPMREMCAYDVALTGDRRFVEAYGEFSQRIAAGTAHATKVSPAKSGAKKAAISISADEIKSSKPVPANEELPVHQIIEAGPGLVFKLQFSEARKHEIASYTPGEKTPAYQAGKPGYAFFDKDGKLIGKPVAAANGDAEVDLPAGTCYLKVVGPGMLDISVR